MAKALFPGLSLLGVIGFGVCFLGLGCGGGSKEFTVTETNLKQLAILYGQYLASNRGKAPSSEPEFKNFLKKMDRERLEAFQVTDIDKLFVSPRDNQPYVVVYRGQGGLGPPGGATVIAYEQTGVDGKRYVALSNTAVEEMDEEKFRQAVP